MESGNCLSPSDFKNTKIVIETNPDAYDNPFVSVYPSPKSSGILMKYEGWISEAKNKAVYPQSLIKEIDQNVSEYFLKRNNQTEKSSMGKGANKAKSVSFKSFSNGDMIQSCYDPKTEESFFMHWIESEGRGEKIVEIEDLSTRERLIPLRDKNVTKGKLLLPSGLEEYGTINSLIREVSNATCTSGEPVSPLARWYCSMTSCVVAIFILQFGSRIFSQILAATDCQRQTS